MNSATKIEAENTIKQLKAETIELKKDIVEAKTFVRKL